MFDEDASQPRFSRSIAHGSIDEHCRDGRIDAARKRADGATAADLLSHLRNGGVDEVLRRPGWLRAADVHGEVAENVGTQRSVVYLGMKLHRPHFAFSVFNGSNSVRSFRGQPESSRQFFGFVAVGHPYGQLVGQALKELRVRFLNLNFRVSIFTLCGGANFAAQRVHHELQAVADSEHGNAEAEDFLIGVRRVLVVDGGRSAGKNYSNRRVTANLFQTRVEW
jgi:hypothetical protein